MARSDNRIKVVCALLFTGKLLIKNHSKSGKISIKLSFDNNQRVIHGTFHDDYVLCRCAECVMMDIFVANQANTEHQNAQMKYNTTITNDNN